MKDESEDKLPTNLPSVTDFGDDAGAGTEGTRLEEQSTPFLRMAQGLSPELNPGKGEHIRGLQLGMIFNTATRDVYDGNLQPPPGSPAARAGEVGGLEMIVCWKDYHYGQWIPRDLGGGYRGALSPDDPLVRGTLARMAEKYGSSARFKMPRYDGKEARWSDEPARTRDTGEEVELKETGQLYVLYAPGSITVDNFNRAIVSCTTTALAAYNGYVTRHMNQLWPQKSGKRMPAPLFAYRWRLSTFLDKRGTNEFYNWRIDLSPVGGTFLDSLYARIDPDLFAAAREFYKLAEAGIVKPDEEAVAAAQHREPGQDDDQVPF